MTHGFYLRIEQAESTQYGYRSFPVILSHPGLLGARAFLAMMMSGKMQRSDGTVEYQFGKEAIGYLAYTLDDFVWFEVNAMNRTPFKGGDWFGTKDENEEAMKTHLSLCGRYKIEEDELHYLMLTSSSPNMVEMSKGGKFFHGATARLDGDVLRLTSKPYVVDGVECQTQYVWKKVKEKY